jgi:hypothetical protein
MVLSRQKIDLVIVGVVAKVKVDAVDGVGMSAIASHPFPLP